MLERTPVVGCAFKMLIVAKRRRRLLQKSRSGVPLPVEPTTIRSIGLSRYRKSCPAARLNHRPKLATRSTHVSMFRAHRSRMGFNPLGIAPLLPSRISRPVPSRT